MSVNNITDALIRHSRSSQLSEYINLSTIGGGPTDASFSYNTSSSYFGDLSDKVTTNSNVKSYCFTWGFNKMGSSAPVGE